MVLLILEISQKQSYIFSSNVLKDNIKNSALIAWVTSSDYFQKRCPQEYDEDSNLVYAGGGHTVLCFDTEDAAKAFSGKVTESLMRDCPDMRVFVKMMNYDDSITPGENLKKLTSALEVKKSLRQSAFSQGTFGIEKTDMTTFEPIRILTGGETEVPEQEKRIDRELLPEGFKNVTKFEELGGDKNSVNFIAVVHIDGNGMGKRVADLYEKLAEEKVSWDEFRKRIRRFSDGIDGDFKAAFKEMNEQIATMLKNQGLEDLKLKENVMPIRRIITSGDDICFVSEGRIGIEASRIFIECLKQKVNAEDKKKYNACAGIAIVHVKYPFFRAYELAEKMCSNAKARGAKLSPEDNGSSVCSLDWHIEYGELGDTVEEIRENYNDADGDSITARPYVLEGPDVEGATKYECFRKMIEMLKKDDAYARTKIKGLRNVLKKTMKHSDYYLDFNKMSKFKDCDRAVLFDAIESMDVYLEL